MIQLSKKILIDSKTKNAALKELHTYTANFLHDELRRFGAPNWEVARNRQDFANRQNHEASQYGHHTLTQIRRRIPGIEFHTDEAKLEIVNSLVEIINSIPGDVDSHIIAYHLLTESLTLVDSIGDSLLVAKGNQSGQIFNGLAPITNLLTIPFKDFTIASYEPINKN